MTNKLQLKNYIICTMISTLLSIILMRYTILVSSAAQYANITLVLVSIGIITTFLTLGINRSLEKVVDDKNKVYSIVKASIIFITINAIIAATIFYITSSYIYLYSVLIAYFDSFYVLLISYYGYKLKSKNVLILTTMRSGLLLLLFYIFSKNIDNLFIGYMLSYVIALIVTLIWYIKKAKIILAHKMDINIVKKSLLFSCPLIFHMVSSTMMNNFDRIQIKHYYDDNSVAIYSSAYLLATFFLLFMTTLNQSYAPVYYKYKNEYRSINKIRNDYFKIVWFCCLVFVAYSDIIAYILISSKYSQGFILISPLIVAYVFYFYNMIYSTTLLYYKKTTLLTLHSVICIIVNLVLNIFLMNYFQYHIAVITTLISFVLWMTLNYLSAKKLDCNISIAKDFKSSRIIITALVVIFIAKLLPYSYFINSTIIIGVGIYYKIPSLVKKYFIS